MESEHRPDEAPLDAVTANEAHDRINALLDRIETLTADLRTERGNSAARLGAAERAELERDEWAEQCQSARAALAACQDRAERFRDIAREPYERGQRDARESAKFMADMVDREEYDTAVAELVFWQGAHVCVEDCKPNQHRAFIGHTAIDTVRAELAKTYNELAEALAQCSRLNRELDDVKAELGEAHRLLAEAAPLISPEFDSVVDHEPTTVPIEDYRELATEADRLRRALQETMDDARKIDQMYQRAERAENALDAANARADRFSEQVELFERERDEARAEVKRVSGILSGECDRLRAERDDHAKHRDENARWAVREQERANGLQRERDRYLSQLGETANLLGSVDSVMRQVVAGIERHREKYDNRPDQEGNS